MISTPRGRMAAAALAGTCLASFAAPGFAQQTAQQGGAQLEEIIVSARRIEENLQTVPIAITAITADTIESQGFHSVNDIAKSIPGLGIVGNRGETRVIFIRGVPGVVGYWADAPAPLTSIALYFDLANVQALKGPQGTLFGISTNGGAILYKPKMPTDKFEGFAEVTLGDYDKVAGQAVLNVPIVQDKVLLRVGVLKNRTGGYIFDQTLQRKIADENYWIGRAALTLKPFEGLQNDTVFNIYKFHGVPGVNPLSEVQNNPNSSSARVFGLAALQALQDLQNSLGRYTVPGSPWHSGAMSWEKQLNIVNTTTLELSDELTLKNIAGTWRQNAFSRSGSGYALPLGGGVTPPGTASGPTYQYSEELQVLGNYGPLSFVAGGFYSRQDRQNVRPTYSMSLGTVSGAMAKPGARTTAVFGQGTYDLDRWVEGLKFTAGYRYTWDNRSLSQQRLNAAGVFTTNFQRTAKFKAPSYTLSATYQLTPDTMLFLTNAKGYTSGGFNSAAPEQGAVFQPESLNNLEGGVKTEWMLGDVQGRTNVSAYHGWYNSVQVLDTRRFDIPGGGNISANLTTNAGKARISGAEGEFTIIPDSSVELSGSVGYMHAKFTKYLRVLANGTVQDRKHLPFVDMPKWKVALNGTYHLPVMEAVGEVSVTANYTWQDSLFRNSEIGFETAPQVQNTPIGVLNMQLDIKNLAGREGLDLQFYVTNLTQEDEDTRGGFGWASGTGYYAKWPADPRMYGVKVRYSF